MFRRIHYDGSRIHLWETTPEGKNVKETIDHEIEYYIPDLHHESKITDIYGNPVIRQTTKSRTALAELLNGGIKCCETDIPETVKFLQKRYAGMDLKPDISIFKIGVLDIEVESGSEFPYPEQAKYPINLITIRNLKNSKTYTFGNRPYTGNSKTVEKYMAFQTEEELLNAFMDFFRHCSFDIITGWNVLGFDIKYIVNRLKILGINKSLSPLNEIYEDKNGNLSIAGLSVLDYMDMYKKFLKIPMSSYALNFVCMAELGEGKMELDGAVNTAYKTDWNKFVEYNINDVDLVHRLDKKRKLIHLCITLAYQALIPFEKTLMTIPLVEGYILKSIHAKNMVMSDRVENSAKEFEGGYCYGREGFYYDVLSFDVESLYPHLIMAFNISPETIVVAPPNADDLIRSTVPDVYYRRETGFFPEIVKGIFEDRKMFKNRMKILKIFKKNPDPKYIADRLHMDQAKVEREIEIIKKDEETEEYYDLQQYVRKILINSAYGCLASPYFHYYNLNNAKAVTLGGQALIKHLSSNIGKYFIDKYKLKENPVVIVDTDSCYIQMREIVERLGVKFASNKERIDFYLKMIEDEFIGLFDRILNEYADKYGIQQIINFKHEQIITKQAVFVKKHYVSETIYNEGIIYDKPKMKFTGIQTVRSDTPDFCRGTLMNLIDLIFKTEDRKKALEMIMKIREDFKKQPIKNIASTKGLNKYEEYASKLGDYMEQGLQYPPHCPIQVRAAIAYNYIIEKDKLPLIPAYKGSKIKFIYVNDNNVAQSNIIGFIGNYPKEFDRYFKIDYEAQFESTFMPVINDLFRIMKWDAVSYEEDVLDGILT